MTQVSCHKCRQALPHESDSWCLGCSAVEALSLELRNIWGSPGSRAVATDIICSGLRQVRALRRLGVSGAGLGPASLATAVCGASPGSLPPPEPANPPKPVVEAPSKSPAKAAEVKEEPKEDSEESGEEETSSGGEPHAGASAKSKAEPQQPLPRRRSGGDGRDREAEHPKESEPGPRLRSRSRKRDRRSSLPERKSERKEKKRRSSGHLSRSCRGGSPKRGESGVHREEGGRRRAHRGGTRHQRLLQGGRRSLPTVSSKEAGRILGPEFLRL